MVVDGDVDVNGDGDEGFSGKAAQLDGAATSSWKISIPPNRFLRDRGALLVAVAVHVNVAVNDHG